VATVSRIDKIIGLFCRISSLSQGSFAKETYNFIDPTSQSHPIWHRMRHVSRGTYKWVTHTYIHTGVFYNCSTRFSDSYSFGLGNQVTWLIHTWHDSFICNTTHLYVTWHIHMWHDSFICNTTHLYVTWLIHIRRDSFICNMTHSYVTWLIYMRHDSWHDSWHDSFICNTTHLYVTWHIHIRRDSFVCDMTQITTPLALEIRWHDSFVCNMTHSYVTWLIYM